MVDKVGLLARKTFTALPISLPEQWGLPVKAYALLTVARQLVICTRFPVTSRKAKAELDAMHFEFFSYVVGKIEVEPVDDLLSTFEEVAPTAGYALSAYRTWSLIKAIGVRETEESMRRSTWHKHKRIMLDAGLTWADLHAQKVTRPKRTLDLSKPVRSWDELRQAAAVEIGNRENP